MGSLCSSANQPRHFYTMATKVAISILLLSLWEPCSAWEEITSLRTSPSIAKEGGSVTISCKANNWWNTCELIHADRFCTQENGGGYYNEIGYCNEKYDNRIKMVGEYKNQHYECAFQLSQVTLEDAGEWICRLHMYLSDEWTEKRTSLMVEPTEPYEVSIVAEPETGLKEGGDVVVKCYSNHPWSTCALEFNGGNCSQEANSNNDDKTSYELGQCDDARISTVGISHNECVFILNGVRLEDGEEDWKCHLMMAGGQWIGKSTTVTVEPQYEVVLEAEPSTGLATGDNVTFSCASNYPWTTCILLHTGNHCELTHADDSNNQCADSRITAVQSHGGKECVFKLRQVTTNDAGSWKCTLLMDHKDVQEWIETETSLEIRQPRTTRHPKVNNSSTYDDPTTSTLDDLTTEESTNKLSLGIAVGAIVLVLVLVSVLFVVRRRGGLLSSAKTLEENKRKNHGNIYTAVEMQLYSLNVKQEQS